MAVYALSGLLTAGILSLVSLPAQAGTPVTALPAASTGTVVQEERVQVTMTTSEAALFIKAVDLASGTCQYASDGCVIGLRKTELLTILQTIKPITAPVTSEDKKETKH